MYSDTLVTGIMAKQMLRLFYKRIESNLGPLPMGAMRAVAHIDTSFNISIPVAEIAETVVNVGVYRQL